MRASTRAANMQTNLALRREISSAAKAMATLPDGARVGSRLSVYWGQDAGWREGIVVDITNELYERNPATLDPLWREFSNGVYRLEGELMVVLDVHRLLNISGRI